jgi:putative flippase GtrA
MLRFLRAVLAGGAATLVDLGVLVLLVSFFHLAPRAANVPALVAGGIVSFVGNRHFVFRAERGSIVRQAALFALVEIVALSLNGVLYDAAMRLFHAHASLYVPIRLATTNLVFVLFSFPLWHFVFRVRAHDDKAVRPV